MKKIRWSKVDVAIEHSIQDPKIKQKIKTTKYGGCSNSFKTQIGK